MGTREAAYLRNDDCGLCFVRKRFLEGARHRTPSNDYRSLERGARRDVVVNPVFGGRVCQINAGVAQRCVNHSAIEQQRPR